MAQYQQISIEGKAYDLSHLDSFAFEFVIPENSYSPAQVYKIEVLFSSHCFTRGIADGEEVIKALIYRRGREKRIFDERRYEWSKRLPDIIRNLGSRRCFHEDRGNFSTTERVDEEANKTEFTIFFKVSNRGKVRGLTLSVESAHIRN